MPTVQESEVAEIVAAQIGVRDAKRALERAQANAAAERTKARADVEDDEWVRVALAQRRERDAWAAHALHERSRARVDRLRALFGLKPRERLVPPR